MKYFRHTEGINNHAANIREYITVINWQGH